MQVVILAGGAGRRFGGAKQFVPVGPGGETLLEITVRDAVRAGCTGAVVVTAPSREDDVRALFAARPLHDCALTVVPQRPDDLPGPAPVARARPWGTAHALWAARDAVTGPFLLFNADDHYGPHAPAALAAALGDTTSEARFALLGYPLRTTLSTDGTVARAVCVTDGAGRLVALREHPAIDVGGRAVGGPDDSVVLPPDAPVSMNAWAFTPAVFPLLADHFPRFLAGTDPARDEWYLPAVLDAAVRAGRAEVLVVPAPDPWCGMTWPGDRARVAALLAERDTVAATAEAFGLDATTPPAPFGKGLVNATWRVDTTDGPRLVQRLSAEVFADPVAVAENAAAAATRIDDALRRGGDRDPRHRLVFLPGPGGRPWYRDPAGAVWRALVHIDGTRPADPARPDEIRAAARAFGRFPALAAAGAGPELRETLPDFHDTPARLATFRAAALADRRGRLARCGREQARLEELAPLAGRVAEAGLPVRPVHNDAKLDNVLVDAESGEALCVVDLDTAMPGHVVHDFGDLVRSAVTGLAEDEAATDRIVVRTDVFATLAAGYLAGAADWITTAERAALVDGALAITYEQALRFLTDHLEGDVYYRVADADHNLRRTRAQLALLERLLTGEATLRNIVAGSARS